MATKTTRIELEMNEAQYAEFEALKKRIGTQEGRRVFAMALTLLKWAADELHKGRAIASVDKDSEGYTEVHLEGLTN